MLLMEKETITLDGNLFIIHKPFCKKKKVFLSRFVELNVFKSACRHLFSLFSLCFLSLLIWWDIDSQTSTNHLLLKGKAIREKKYKINKNMLVSWI